MRFVFIIFYLGIIVIVFLNGFQRIVFYQDWPNGLQNIAIALLMLMMFTNYKPE